MSAPKILQLWNLLDVSEVKNEQEKDELIEMVTVEMEEYGELVKVVVKVDAEHSEEPRRVQVFVEFLKDSDAKSAFDGMKDRWFAGRLVAAQLHNDYSLMVDAFEKL